MIPLTLVLQVLQGKSTLYRDPNKTQFFISHHKSSHSGYGHEYLELFVECREFSQNIYPLVPFCTEKHSETQFALIRINVYSNIPPGLLCLF